MVFAGEVFVARKSSLKYVIRSNGAVVMPHPNLLLKRPYSTLKPLTEPTRRDELFEALRRSVPKPHEQERHKNA